MRRAISTLKHVDFGDPALPGPRQRSGGEQIRMIYCARDSSTEVFHGQSGRQEEEGISEAREEEEEGRPQDGEGDVEGQVEATRQAPDRQDQAEGQGSRQEGQERRQEGEQEDRPCREVRGPEGRAEEEGARG
jgi:hypothetical protein